MTLVPAFGHSETAFATCPLVKLSNEFQQLAETYNRLDEADTKGCVRAGVDKMTVWHRMQAIHVAASYERPRSAAGAAFQIALASAGSDTLSGSTMSEYESNALQAQIDRTLFAAYMFLTGDKLVHSFLLTDPNAIGGGQ